MQEFTGLEYVKIDVANQFGLDRLEWKDRIHWVNNNRPDLPALARNSPNPILMEKAVRALEDAEKRIPIDFVMGLDATASGLQMMAAMSGCRKTALCVNVVDAGRRADVYQDVSEYMNKHGAQTDRKMLKQPIMTYFYGSKAQPKAVFGVGENLDRFYSTMKELMPGAMELMQLFQSFWDRNAERYSWAMPDGHFVYFPVMGVIDKGLEIDEAHHLRFTHRIKVPQAQATGRALAANITHAVDAYVCRQMVRKSQQQGFYLVPIHDCFFAHPNDMNKVRRNYMECLAELRDQDIVTNILQQISPGKPLRVNGSAWAPREEFTGWDVLNSEYCLS